MEYPIRMQSEAAPRSPTPPPPPPPQHRDQNFPDPTKAQTPPLEISNGNAGRSTCPCSNSKCHHTNTDRGKQPNPQRHSAHRPPHSDPIVTAPHISAFRPQLLPPGAIMEQEGNSLANLAGIITTLQVIATAQAIPNPQVPAPQGGTIPRREPPLLLPGTSLHTAPQDPLPPPVPRKTRAASHP